MRCFAKSLLVLALAGGVLPRTAAGQTPTAPADSAPYIPPSTWVRIQVIDGGPAWQVGELAHLLPSQCVIVMVPVPGSQTGEAVAVTASHFTRLEIARGGLKSDASAAPDARDDARWVPYSMEALRQHEIAAGCAKAATGSNAPPGS